MKEAWIFCIRAAGGGAGERHQLSVFYNTTGWRPGEVHPVSGDLEFVDLPTSAQMQAGYQTFCFCKLFFFFSL